MRKNIRQRIKENPNLVKEIISLYQKPQTLLFVAKFFNSCSRAIKRILLENNIVLHTQELNEKIHQENIKASNLEKYGCENVFQAKEVKEKN